MRRNLPVYGHDFGLWSHLAGMILFLLFLTAIGLLIALLVRQSRSHRGEHPAATPPVPGEAPLPGQPPVPGAPYTAVAPLPMDALRILDERLARGDIDVADYASRRLALTGEHVSPRPTPPVVSPDETRIDPNA